ncbi:MAG: pyridoxamine 5'-phosphate oxidase family protein [Pseudomonadota bacterium]
MDFEKLEQDYVDFPCLFESLMLSTINKKGLPHASYAPFIINGERCFYVYVSRLSEHTNNLLNGSSAAIMLIDDESKTKNIYARRRLMYDCDIEHIERNCEHWKSVIALFADRFGNLISMLRELPDFELIKLRPTSGRFVVGFGAAYEVDKSNLFRLHPTPSK